MSTRTKPDGRSVAARQRAATLRKEARRAEQRRRLRTIAAGVALILAVAVGIGVQAARSTSDRPDGVPAGVVGGVGVALGGSAPVTVDVYEDFLCPACGRFEAAVGPELRRLAAEGKVRIVYRPMAFLDGYSTTRYSTRALNAAACAIDAGLFADYHTRLFEAQPAEGGPGLSDDQLIELGRDAGITDDDFAGCVDDMRYERWTQQATDAASKAGVVQTPTVRINGHDLLDPTVDGLREAVANATH